jgi:hypothetical protein
LLASRLSQSASRRPGDEILVLAVRNNS